MIRVFPQKQSLRGAALTTAILTLLIVLSISGALLILRKTSIRQALHEVQKAKAQYLAEAGVAKAIFRLKNNLSWRARDFSEELSEKGSCLLTVEDTPGGLSIVSRAQIKDGPKASLKVGLMMAYHPAFERALYCQSFLQANGSQVKANGLLSSRDRVFISGGESRAFQIENFSKVGFPEIEPEETEKKMGEFSRMLSEPTRADKLYTTHQTFTRAHQPNFSEHPVIYIQGNVTFEGGEEALPLELSGPGTLISSGKIILSKSTHITGPVTLISGEGFLLEDSAHVESATLFSQGPIQMTDGSGVSGTVLSRLEVSLDKSARITDASSLVYVSAARRDGNVIGKISLDGKSQAQGTLIVYRDPALGAPRKEVFIRIGPQALVKGIALSTEEVDLEGAVYGCVIAQSMKGGKWEKGEIDRGKIPEDFVMPKILEARRHRAFRIVSWERP